MIVSGISGIADVTRIGGLMYALLVVHRRAQYGASAVRWADSAAVVRGYVPLWVRTEWHGTSHRTPDTGHRTPDTGHRAPATGLRVPPEALQFGRVWSTSAFDWTLPLENSTGSPLIVESLSTSCGCTVLSGFKLPIEIPAHSSRDVALAIDLRGRTLPSGEDRPFSVNVYAVEAGGATASWEIRGEVGDAYWMKTPKDLELQCIAGSGQGCSIEVPFGKTTGLSEIDATSDLDGLEVSNLAGSPPDDFCVKLTMKPTLVSGVANGNLTLHGTLNGKLVSSDWPVKIVTVSEITLVPEFTHFGAVSLGVELVRNYSCTSRLDRTLGELDVSVSDELNAKVEVQARNDTFSLSVVAVAEGRFSFDVIITERGVSGTESSVPSTVRIHCSGLAHAGI